MVRFFVMMVKMITFHKMKSDFTMIKGNIGQDAFKISPKRCEKNGDCHREYAE